MIIHLDDIALRANHGVYAEEREQGNWFRVSVRMELADVKGCESDCIEDTLNYQEVYDTVKEEMGKPSALLECVATRIVRALHMRFPEIREARVDVSKMNPPLGGEVAAAGVSVGVRFDESTK